jgi:hypothetical protein
VASSTTPPSTASRPRGSPAASPGVIPNKYRVDGEGGAGHEFVSVNQICTLEGPPNAGRTTVTKGTATGTTATVTRSPGTAAAPRGRGRRHHGEANDEHGDHDHEHAGHASPVDVAQRGVAPASEPLPHLDRIQPSFGRHDVSGVRTSTARPSTMDFGEPSREVHALACVKVPAGAYLRQSPRPDAAPTHATPVPLGGRIWITRSTLHTKVAERWCYVVAPDHGVTGFVPERWLLLNPPEPQARVHLVKKHETLHQIATQAYGKNFDEGNDARLYVQGLYLANQDLPSVKLTPISLPFRDTVHRKEAEEETLKIYRGVQVIEGGALWIPSEDFIQRLKAEGAITSGSSELSKAWRTARDAVGAIIDTIKYVAGFIVGLLEGAWAAIADLFKGAADLVEGVAKIVWKLVSEGPGAVKALLDKWAGQMKQVWEKKGEIASAFLKKWNATNAWDRGNFHGEVMGWLFMTVLIVVVTMGESAPATLASITLRWPELVAVLKAVDALGDVTRYVGGAAKAAALAAGLPADAIANITTRFGRRADKGHEAARLAERKAAETGGGVKGKDVYPEKTSAKKGGRAIANAEDAGGGARADKKNHRPDLENETTSLDGRDFHNDIRKMSPEARHVIRQLEDRGWVRVADILPEDLVDISKWFGREIGVLQSPYSGKLRIVLGTRDGVLTKQLKAGEVFVVHTHPVMLSKKGHFDLDIPNAGKHTEAVIDWSGQITYFNKTGIKNPIRPDGTVDPLLGYEAAFLNERGAIGGFAKIDIVDGLGGATIKVRE